MTVHNHATIAIDPFELSKHFSELLKNAVYGFCFKLKEHVFATHREIVELRRCSEFVRNEPNRVVHIVAPKHPKQRIFYKKTLMHLGVSCGQINLDTDTLTSADSKDVWLFVAEK